MTVSEDLDQAIERSHVALGEFVKGDPEPLKNLYSHRDDVSLANPLFPARRGWQQAADAMERAALNYRDGKAIGFETIAKYVTPELAYILEVERYEVKIGGREGVFPVALRVTSVFRPEDGVWKIMHRHADPITTERSAESLLDNREGPPQEEGVMTQQNDIVQQLTGVLRQQGSRPLNELDALMANTAADWQRCLQAMTEAQACFHFSEGPDVTKPWSGEGAHWCAKEVIGHFLFSHRSLNQRIAETAGLPPPAVEVPRVQAMGEQSAEDERQPIDELRRRLDGFFDDTRALLSSLESKGVPKGVLSFPHPVFGPLTVTEWIAFHWLHTMDHVGQINAVKSAPGYPAA